MQEVINVAVLIFPGVEVIDMNGPIDVFTKANYYIEGRYHVYTVAETADAIESEGSTLRIVPRCTIADCPPPNIVVIPGQIMPAGSARSYGDGSPALLAWLREQAQHPGTRIMSVCIGAYILAHTGLLNKRKATTHWEALQDIQREYPDIEFIKDVRYVTDGQFITTGGVTSGIDGALYLVEELDGGKIAQEVADVMVYNREAPLPPNTISH